MSDNNKTEVLNSNEDNKTETKKNPFFLYLKRNNKQNK